MKKQQSIHIFVGTSTPRLQYASYLVFDLLLGLKPVLHQDIALFNALEVPKINYSRLNIDKSFQIFPTDILFERDIKAFIPEHKEIDNTSYLFPTSHGNIHFDPLAASFYVATRYEEYLPINKDKHLRFPAKESIQYKLHCLHLPIVQIWVAHFAAFLIKMFPSLKIKTLQRHFQPTFDIDMAWSYKEKGAYRNIGAGFRDLSNLKISALKERWSVISNQSKDPFDTFAYIEEQTTTKQLEPCYFFLMAKQSEYDKNIEPTNTKFVQLIQDIASRNTIGIHPSYFSAKHLDHEIKTLQQATGKAITRSRQHYIRLEFPNTYRYLIKNKIEHDYTMGYPDQIGFRNGLAVPTFWYDLKSDQQTTLVIHPFQIMDVSLKNYLSLSPDEAVVEVKKITDTIHEYGGTMISIWHNSSFDQQWAGWEKVFEEILSYASKRLISPRL